MKKTCALPKSTFPLKFKVKSPAHALELARKLIVPFKHWTIGALAVADIEDELELKPQSARAEAFCALGALLRVNTRHARKAELYLQQAACHLKAEHPDSACRDDIFEVNDRRRDKATHRHVLKMFTKAIHLAKRAAAPPAGR